MKRLWHQTHNFFRKKLAKPFAVVFFTVTFFFILYHFFYAQRIIPGVKIGNLKMGGKTSSQAYEALRKELSEKGIKQAQKFSWKKTAEKTIKVYEKVLEF